MCGGEPGIGQHGKEDGNITCKTFSGMISSFLSGTLEDDSLREFLEHYDKCENCREEVEIQVKYAGYIQRQLRQVEQFRKEEDRALPPDIDYQQITGLRLEARQKLAAIRPMNLGQASRVSGVSPADMAVLMIYLELREEEKQ